MTAPIFDRNSPIARHTQKYLRKLMKSRFKWGKRVCEYCGAKTPSKDGVPYHRHLRTYGGKEQPEDIVWLCKPCLSGLNERRKAGALLPEDAPFVDPTWTAALEAGQQPEKRKRGRPRKNPVEPERPKRKYTRQAKPEPEKKDWSKEIQNLKTAIIQAGKQNRMPKPDALAIMKRLDTELKEGGKPGEVLKRYRQELANL